MPLAATNRASGRHSPLYGFPQSKLEMRLSEKRPVAAASEGCLWKRADGRHGVYLAANPISAVTDARHGGAAGLVRHQSAL